jgi:protein Tex
MLEPNYQEIIAERLDLKTSQIQVVLDLTAEGSTVPFIARYRKERTGGLDETEIRAILELHTSEVNLYKAKLTALTGIEEQGKLTPELRTNIELAKTQKEVEDIYAPYRLKKKTKAMIAIEKGFQVVADMIRQNRAYEIPSELLELYSKEEILEWACHILSAEIAADAQIRDTLRQYIERSGMIHSKQKSEKMLEKLNEKTRGEVKKFEIYADFCIQYSRIKPYQTLALNRGENLGILNVKIEKDEVMLEKVRDTFPAWRLLPELELAIKDGFEMLFSSLENELRGQLTDIAEDASILTFQDNLSSLLMTRPEYGKVILGIDPGYRTGCKIVILDTLGNPIKFSKIFLDTPKEAEKILKDLHTQYVPEVIIIGNGTGSNETVELVSSVLTEKIYIVNESGASVYSASELAQKEFPELDVTDRGTISIARRYIDPLSELVKIPVGSIWVGMYQHDIQPKKLEEKLGYTVEDVVNHVWVNVNIASVSVLEYISGLDKRSAKKVYNHRPYKNRHELAKVLSEKGYEQAVGFLRIPESRELLDNTNIHPEQYELARYVIENDIEPRDFDHHGEKIRHLYPQANTDTLVFIRESYRLLGKDPRVNSGHTEAKKKASFESLKEGDILTGIVRNVVAFGAFVDVGLKNDGLVHISELADQYVKNPLDIVQVGQSVKVRVTKVDLDSKKVQLSMKGI